MECHPALLFVGRDGERLLGHAAQGTRGNWCGPEDHAVQMSKLQVTWWGCW